MAQETRANLKEPIENTDQKDRIRMPTATSKKNPRQKKLAATRKKAKRPNQARSKARVEAILRAAENLLAKHTQEEIGPYEIAEEAGIPPGSVYYFFPTIGDLWAELTKQVARRTIVSLLQTSMNPDVAASGWQAMFELNLASTVDFYNNNPALAELILGPNTSREVYTSFDKGDITTAKISEKIMKKYYHLPNMPKLRLKLVTAIVASEAILKQSYRTHGYITDELKQESLNLLISYMRTILPEELELRE